jgi:hypothetical protein
LGGKILDYEYNEKKVMKNRKYNDEQIKIIKSINDTKKPKKVILKELKEKHNINIGITTFNILFRKKYYKNILKKYFNYQ